MDVLWSPWRYDYIKDGESSSLEGCVFCRILSNSATDEENFILKRAEFNFVILNIYPYVSGHLMIVPYEHIGDLHKAPSATTDEMMELMKVSERAIREAYTPDGLNLGMNIGRAAGAGVADHFHMHVLPRWIGDANFLTAVGQTRSIPETLQTSYDKLRPRL